MRILETSNKISHTQPIKAHIFIKIWAFIHSSGFTKKNDFILKVSQNAVKLFRFYQNEIFIQIYTSF